MPDSENSDDFESADEDIAEEKTYKGKETRVSQSNSQESIVASKTDDSNANSSWKSWSAFGMISSASKSVANVTTKMTQSLTTVIESINIPEPEDMAKIHAEQKKTLIEEKTDIEEKKIEQRNEEDGGVFKLDSILSNVGLISSKVVSGGLDTLEEIGKKTMNILQDTDPNIKNKLLSINSNKPNLSEILKEAKNSESTFEIENKSKGKSLISFEHLLEENNGLVYFEALEILSNQSKMKIELLLKPLTGKSLMEMEETLKEVQELCELPDSDSVNDNITTSTLKDELHKAIEDLSITVNFNDIVSYFSKIETFLIESKDDEIEAITVYNKSIKALAKLCSLSMNNYQKLAELMLSLDHRSTADEVDAVIQLTSIYFNLLNYVATNFTEKIGKCRNEDNGKSMSMELFVECSNAITNVKKAFNIFIPILQIGAL